MSLEHKSCHGSICHLTGCKSCHGTINHVMGAGAGGVSHAMGAGKSWDHNWY